MFKFCSILCLLLAMCQPSMAEPIRIVAAENFYGFLAKEIGGSYVQVKSIINQPDQDPHLFNVSPSIAKQLGQADLVVYNGLGYDSWMQSLLSVNTLSARTVICVGELVNKKEGDNPHIWYDPMTMLVYAKALLGYLSKKDPHHQTIYRIHYQQFFRKYNRLTRFIHQLKPRTENLEAIATEPVFAYMAEALGFNMQGFGFQISMMNGIDPSPRQILEFQRRLQSRQVKILFYNKQVDSPLIQRLLGVAKTYAIPVIGVTETQPVNTSYRAWMMEPLKQVQMVLNEQRHHI
jgi:zinc/manganese transport system substrate-binding protein